MYVSQLAGINFGATFKVAPLKQTINKGIGTQVAKQNRPLLNRAILQGSSSLRNLNYWDYDYDDTPMSDTEYFDRKNKTYDKYSEAKDVVRGMTITGAFSGFFGSKFGGLDIAACMSIIGVMCSRISAIYGIYLKDSISDSLVKTLGAGVKMAYASKVANAVPLFGGLINGAVDAILVKDVGDKMINLFDKADSSAKKQLEFYEKMNGILEENERLRKREELLNKALEELIEEEKKKNS